MILSAIGLPVPGQSFANIPTPPPDRAEGVQAVAAAVASGGASRSRDASTDSGSGAGRQSARDEARVIRLSSPAQVSGASQGRAADKIAGPQPAFEIAVLEKLREDAMRVPPEAAAAPADVRQDAPAAQRVPQVEVQRDAAPAQTAGNAATEADTAAEPVSGTAPATDRGPGGKPRTSPEDRDVPREASRTPAPTSERAEARERPREPADDGFDDARRMSEERSPPKVDVTR